MKILVRAKPGAKTESVQKVEGLFPASGGVDAPQFVVSVKEPPVDGKANRAVERALAEYFHVAPSQVRIVAGHASREKYVIINSNGSS
jgi:hypothetical protein